MADGKRQATAAGGLARMKLYFQPGRDDDLIQVVERLHSQSRRLPRYWANSLLSVFIQRGEFDFSPAIQGEPPDAAHADAPPIVLDLRTDVGTYPEIVETWNACDPGMRSLYFILMLRAAHQAHLRGELPTQIWGQAPPRARPAAPQPDRVPELGGQQAADDERQSSDNADSGGSDPDEQDDDEGYDFDALELTLGGLDGLTEGDEETEG